MPLGRKSKSKSKQKLTRQDWLENALVTFSKKGQAGLSLQNISAALGVSRGSFYWHFKDRDDFIHALLQHWYEEYSAAVPAVIERDGGTAEERLARFMRLMHDKDLRRYDLIFRSFAIHDSQFARWVRKADRFRLKFVERLFAEMGFTEKEIRIRARICLVCITFEHEFFDKLDLNHGSDLLDDLHALVVIK
jgi:AcrR family transcriptional regulator